jgi:hypothetical protein
MIEIPVLVMKWEDDEICPFPSSGARSVKLPKRGTLKVYPGFPHGMPTTHAAVINSDLLAFTKVERGLGAYGAKATPARRIAAKAREAPSPHLPASMRSSSGVSSS